MTNILDMRRESDAEPFAMETLDSLWDRASALGRVEINHAWGSKAIPTVIIKFERSSGSSVYAQGSHSDIREAFRLAIMEATLLKE